MEAKANDLEESHMIMPEEKLTNHMDELLVIARVLARFFNDQYEIEERSPKERKFSEPSSFETAKLVDCIQQSEN